MLMFRGIINEFKRWNIPGLRVHYVGRWGRGTLLETSRIAQEFGSYMQARVLAEKRRCW
jgi:hypothetical protein